MADAQTNGAWFDVIVAGDGPAAGALCWRLARSGWRVALATGVAPEHEACALRALPAGAGALLQRTGFSQSDIAALTQASPGLLSFWGDAPVADPLADHVLDTGLMVDRNRLSAALRRRARAAGTQILERTVLARAVRHPRGDSWGVTLVGASASRDVRSRFLVDATGRAAAVAGLLGVKPRMLDTLLAITLDCCSTTEADEPLMNVLEAVPEGWWLASAGAGVHQLQLATDSEIAALAGFTSIDRLMKVLAAAPAVMQRLVLADHVGQPRALAAHTQVLPRTAGPGWLAIGEAALAFDPLVCCGLEFALSSAELAHASLVRSADGETTAAAAYDATMQSQFNDLLEVRGQLYAAAGDRDQHAFWQRRGPRAAVWRQRRTRELGSRVRQAA